MSEPVTDKTEYIDSPMSHKTKHIDNPQWLRGVRQDLDSKADIWASPSKPDALSKMESIGQSLDTILTELGYKRSPHRCPLCGQEHQP